MRRDQRPGAGSRRVIGSCSGRGCWAPGRCRAIELRGPGGASAAGNRSRALRGSRRSGAWKGGHDSLVALARRYAPNLPLIANGGLHDASKAREVVEAGADIVAFGKGALANPDLPDRIGAVRELTPFDPAILGPIADIKAQELTH
ncbi:tRNA-dihydrouridine synthase [Methylobacterium oryzisoli]|uniref:tRNA-dihydrouridine synthase n=1 Tax=Methylobacterium oryzisoli TaxID=3385502 RepID=UPI0038929A69